MHFSIYFVFVLDTLMKVHGNKKSCLSNYWQSPGQPDLFLRPWSVSVSIMAMVNQSAAMNIRVSRNKSVLSLRCQRDAARICC